MCFFALVVLEGLDFSFSFSLSLSDLEDLCLLEDLPFVEALVLADMMLALSASESAISLRNKLN